MSRILALLAALAVAGIFSACWNKDAAQTSTGANTVTNNASSTTAGAVADEIQIPKEEPTALVQIDKVVGTGAPAENLKNVSVHYTGWLKNGDKLGSKFDSSVDRGQPFNFTLGRGMVIQGWDEGVKGMKEGGTRWLIIPSKMGYGERGAGGVIPPNATLIFKVQLLKTG